VTNLADAGPGSLRQAIIDTPAGGTVDFQQGLRGTITLTTGELPIAKSLTITGPGSDVLTVSGNHVSRVFDITGSVTVAISGLTIADGNFSSNSGYGGAIDNFFGTLTLTDCTLSGNFANVGGGAIYSTGMLTLTDCTLSGNFTNVRGGGIYSTGTLTVTTSTLTGNTANAIAGGRGGAIYAGGIYSAMGTLTVTDSTLSGNVADEGAGIWSSGELTVTTSTLTGNTTGYSVVGRGGAIYSSLGTLTLTSSTLSGNFAGEIGGGIDNENSVATITGTTLSGNVADECAAICSYGPLTLTSSTISSNMGIGQAIGTGSVTITDSIISGNHCGAIGTGGPSTITDSIISGNSSPANISGSGGIENGGTLVITNSILSGNTADDGGAIWNLPSATLTITGSTLTGNTARNAAFGGGGISNEGTLAVTNSTLNGNVAGSGGGIKNYGPLTLTSSTLSGNVANAGPGGGIWISGSSADTQPRNTIIAGNMTTSTGPDVSGPLDSQGHNLIGKKQGGTGYVDSDLLNVDPLLGPLQDNGGPTPTMALLLGSPAIDAGDNTDAPATDQRGAPRIFNGTIDIGAYEVQAAPAPRCSVTTSLLWPPNHQLINVGLAVPLNDDADPSTQLHVQVFGNDGARPADAADIGPGTLRLRAERQGSGGRVYLVVALADDASGQSGFDVCAVVVPHDHRAGSIAEVQAEAAAAEAYYRAFQSAPPGYAFLGAGPARDGGVASLASGRPSSAFALGGVPFVSWLPATSQALIADATPGHTPSGSDTSGTQTSAGEGFLAARNEDVIGVALLGPEKADRGEMKAWPADLLVDEGILV
jgi:predicted outer membrane repeat protein